MANSAVMNLYTRMVPLFALAPRLEVGGNYDQHGLIRLMNMLS